MDEHKHCSRSVQYSNKGPCKDKANYRLKDMKGTTFMKQDSGDTKELRQGPTVHAEN